MSQHSSRVIKPFTDDADGDNYQRMIERFDTLWAAVPSQRAQQETQHETQQQMQQEMQQEMQQLLLRIEQFEAEQVEAARATALFKLPERNENPTTSQAASPSQPTHPSK
tara:strand:+ start:44314 stop:44643 length:330 start_codon:yes stop_codon:yes gene_type:complete